MNSEDGQGYSWRFFYATPAWVRSTVAALLAIGGSAALFVWYIRTGGDSAPDSILGLAYALIGTLGLVLAALLFSLRRRSRKRGLGELNAALQWHMALGITAIAIIFMHSFGNFNPRSGTYALYGMIALVISGIIGRFLDRIMPRLIAQEVSKALTTQGEDRIETISQKLQDIVTHNSQEVLAFTSPARPASLEQPAFASAGLQSSWDLAYITLEETPQEIRRDTTQYRFVPDRRSALTRPGALIPGAQEHISELHNVQTALAREQFYRYIISYWRVFHIILALVTVGLTIWHITYAMQLLIPTLMH